MSALHVESCWFAALGLFLTGTLAEGQMPGLPIFQNAFANPGITAGLNYGRASELTGYGVAGAWAPGSARLVLSGGAGRVTPATGKGTTAYGARIAVPVVRLMNGSVGLGAFGGVGGASQSSTSIVVAGISAGYRRSIGSLGFSVHAAPSYQRASVSAGGLTASAAMMRVSAGVDVSFGGRYGATIGVETGASAADDEPGPHGSVFGLGLSYALRRVQ